MLILLLPILIIQKLFPSNDLKSNNIFCLSCIIKQIYTYTIQWLFNYRNLVSDWTLEDYFDKI